MFEMLKLLRTLTYELTSELGVEDVPLMSQSLYHLQWQQKDK